METTTIQPGGVAINNGAIDEDPILSTADIAQFARDGFVVVRQLISADEAIAIRDSFMKMNENGPIAGLSEIRHGTSGEVFARTDPLGFFARMIHPHRHPDKPVGPLAMKYMLDSRIRNVLISLMGQEPFAVQSMFYFKPPGSRGQDFHQDNFYLRVKPGTCMAAWIAVDDCDEENGGMACVPNTATLETQCPTKADSTKSFTTEHVEPPPGCVPQVLKLQPGDVLFFNGQTIHGSGPNISKDRFRRSLICHYVPQSTMEMSDWYEAYDFAGKQIPIKTNQDGGPCGTPVDMKAVH